MILCAHAQAKVDKSGRIEYYCLKYAWRMDLGCLEQCRHCQYYK